MSRAFSRSRDNTGFQWNDTAEFVDSEWPDGPLPGDNKKMIGKGYVTWIDSKPFGGGMSWTFRLRNEDKWFNCGNTDPKVSKGDHIEFSFQEKNGRVAVDAGSVKRLEGGEVHQGTSSGTLASSREPGAAAPKSDYALKEQYWSDKAKGDAEKDLRIQWQSARNAAIEITGILVSNGILKLPEKNGSDAVIGKVADLTERFYRESANPPALAGVDDSESSAEAA